MRPDFLSSVKLVAPRGNFIKSRLLKNFSSIKIKFFPKYQLEIVDYHWYFCSSCIIFNFYFWSLISNTITWFIKDKISLEIYLLWYHILPVSWISTAVSAPARSLSWELCRISITQNIPTVLLFYKCKTKATTMKRYVKRMDKYTYQNTKQTA